MQAVFKIILFHKLKRVGLVTVAHAAFTPSALRLFTAGVSLAANFTLCRMEKLGGSNFMTCQIKKFLFLEAEERRNTDVFQVMRQ